MAWTSLAPPTPQWLGGRLSCRDVWPLLMPGSAGTPCEFRWAPGAPMPEVNCAAVAGYDRIADLYSTIALITVTYQLVESAGIAVGANGSWSGWCMYQSSFSMRKVDSLEEVAEYPLYDFKEFATLLANLTQNRDSDSDILLVTASQGLQHIRFEFSPTGIGPCAAFVTNDDCPWCPAELWITPFDWDNGALPNFVNSAQKLFMVLKAAFTPLASFMMGVLQRGSLVEEIEIHGGENWDDNIFIAVELRHLRKLDLSGNGIPDISDKNFLNMPHLVHLNISNNRLSTIPRGIQLLRHLKTVDLSRNPILTQNAQISFGALPYLIVLNLSAIFLNDLNFLLRNNTSEDILDRSTLISKNLYLRLEVLDVSGCNVSSAESGLWATARRLRTLRLADNPLASVPASLPARLPALQELDLGGCQLRAPPSLRLAPAPRLRRLVLARNLLATPRGALAPAAGAGAPERLHVDLSGNPLRGEWEADAFAALGEGASVNLSRTGLTALSPQMLRSLRPLAQVDLGGNPFDCANCSILHLQHWLRNGTTPELLSLGQRSPLACELPPDEIGHPVVKSKGPSPDLCAAVNSGWDPATVVGAVTVVLLLTSAILALVAFRFRFHLTYVMHVRRANRKLKAGTPDQQMKCEFDAFICYSKHDRMWVLNALLPELEGNHPSYRLCLHERDFPLGSLVVQNIVECMGRSRRTVMVLTPSFVDSQWCQWELEMATHRLLEGAGRDFLVLVELQRLEARALPRLLRLLVETRTFLQWPAAEEPNGCAGDGAEGVAWKRLRAALGPPLERTSPSADFSSSFVPGGETQPASRRCNFFGKCAILAKTKC